LTWKATSKISTAFDTGLEWATINDARVGGAIIKRDDLLRTHSFSITYLAAQHVSVRTYVTRRTRNSTFSSSQFNSTIGGLELSATFD
jgi:hypothetical protein